MSNFVVKSLILLSSTIHLHAHRSLQQVTQVPFFPFTPPTTPCPGCVHPITGECTTAVSCAARQYCQTTDPTSPDYITCDAFPYAQCKFTDCGECREYFVDYFDSVLDCNTPPVIGEVCGTQGIDCPITNSAAYQCSDGLNCYGNCGTCTWENDEIVGVFCSSIVLRDRVCPYCGGFDHCLSYNNGCVDCLCQDRNDYCDNRYLCTKTGTPHCVQCIDGYAINPNTNLCEPIIGAQCGTQGIECAFLTSPDYTCPDGVSCYGNCDMCTWENDEIVGVFCSSIVLRDRVCPIVCGGFDNCAEFNNGCQDCICNADGSETCDMTQICYGSITGRNVAQCTKCRHGYLYNEKTLKCELPSCETITCTEYGHTCYDMSHESQCCDANVCENGICSIGVQGLQCESGYECVSDPLMPCDNTMQLCFGVCVDLNAKPLLECGIGLIRDPKTQLCVECACPEIYMPVCCGGVTYGNVCSAQCQNVNANECIKGYCFVKEKCIADSDCDTLNGFLCFVDPVCRDATAMMTNPDCVNGGSEICFHYEGYHCDKDIDCDMLNGFQCLGIDRKTGKGVCGRYGIPL